MQFISLVLILISGHPVAGQKFTFLNLLMYTANVKFNWTHILPSSFRGGQKEVLRDMV